VVFLNLILCYSPNGDDPQEDLARFRHKLNMKLDFKKASFYTFGYLPEPCIKIWCFFFLNFDQILPIENFKKLMILALSICDIAFWLHIYI
jgi:hypothetical protein